MFPRQSEASSRCYLARLPQFDAGAGEEMFKTKRRSVRGVLTRLNVTLLRLNLYLLPLKLKFHLFKSNRHYAEGSLSVVSFTGTGERC